MYHRHKLMIVCLFVIVFICLLSGLASACELWGIASVNGINPAWSLDGMGNNTFYARAGAYHSFYYVAGFHGTNGNAPDGWGFMAYKTPVDNTQGWYYDHRQIGGTPTRISNDATFITASFIANPTTRTPILNSDVNSAIVHARWKGSSDSRTIVSPHPFLFGINDQICSFEHNGGLTNTASVMDNKVGAGFLAMKPFQDQRYSRFYQRLPSEPTNQLVDTQEYFMYLMRNLLAVNTYLGGTQPSNIQKALRHTLNNMDRTTSLNALFANGDGTLWAVATHYETETSGTDPQNIHNLFYTSYDNGNAYVVKKHVEGCGYPYTNYLGTYADPATSWNPLNAGYVYHITPGNGGFVESSAYTTDPFTETNLKEILASNETSDNTAVSVPAIAAGWNGMFASAYDCHVTTTAPSSPAGNYIKMRWFDQMGMIENNELIVSDNIATANGNALHPDIAFQWRPEMRYSSNTYESLLFTTGEPCKNPKLSIVWEETQGTTHYIKCRGYQFHGDDTLCAPGTTAAPNRDHWLHNNTVTPTFQADQAGIVTITSSTSQLNCPKITFDDAMDREIVWEDHSGTYSVIMSQFNDDDPLQVSPLNATYDCLRPKLTFVGTCNNYMCKRFAVVYEKINDGTTEDIDLVQIEPENGAGWVTTPYTVTAGLNIADSPSPSLANVSTWNGLVRNDLGIVYGPGSTTTAATVKVFRILSTDQTGTITQYGSTFTIPSPNANATTFPHPQISTEFNMRAQVKNVINVCFQWLNTSGTYDVYGWSSEGYDIQNSTGTMQTPVRLNDQDQHQGRYPAIAISQQFPMVEGTRTANTSIERLYRGYPGSDEGISDSVLVASNLYFMQRRMVVWSSDETTTNMIRGHFHGLYINGQGNYSLAPWSLSDPSVLCVPQSGGGGGLRRNILTSGNQHLTDQGIPYYLANDLTIGANDTLKIESGVSLYCAPAKTLTVQGTLLINGIAGREALISTDPDSSSANWKGIHIVSGGKFIGISGIISHADSAVIAESGSYMAVSGFYWENLPCAIKSKGGRVELDWSTFDNCNAGIYVTTLSDSVLVNHSTFTSGSLGIYSHGNGGSQNEYLWLRNSTFDQQSDKALDLYQASIALVDSCTFTGNSNIQCGIYLESCTHGVHISNSTISQFQYGITSLYSNARLSDDLITANVKAGISWSNDYSGDTWGRIDRCTITNNGSSANYGGFLGYACSPIFTCNHFEGNSYYAVNLSGNAAPSFYDQENATVGDNDFYGISGYAMVYINNASPVFTSGENDFHLLIGTKNPLNYYMQQASNYKTFDLTMNQFEGTGTPLNYFIPSVSKYWTIGTQSTGSVCGENLDEYMSSGNGNILRGDIFYGAGLIENARSCYDKALVESGDTTSTGSASLQRLSKINPLLPQVSGILTKDKLYLTSYSFDAESNFTAADAIRDKILSNANSYDSLRINYDLAASGQLRSTRNQNCNLSEAERNRTQAHCRELFEMMMNKLLAKSNAEIANANVELPKTFALHNAYPNPFNPETNIRFDLPIASPVKLVIYNALGRMVSTLVSSQSMDAGYHETKWNAQRYSSGVYFVHMQAGSFTSTKKLMLLK